MIDYSEKRDFHRMQMDCDVTLQAIDGERTETGRLADLSATGMRFIIEAAMAEGERFTAHIIPQHEITPPLAAEIVVRRCTAQGNGYEIAAGIERILEQRISA